MEPENPFESFLNSVFIQSGSNNSVSAYRIALNHLGKFVESQYHFDAPELLKKIKAETVDIFRLLNDFIAYLHKLGLKPKSIKLAVTAAKGYLRYSGIRIYNEDFKQLVKLPKVRRYREEPLTKETLLRLLRNIPTKLQTVVLVAVASGIRIGEIVQLTISDIDFESKPTRIKIRAETTKTKESRETFLTTEATKALKDYLQRYYGWQEGQSNETLRNQIIFGRTSSARKKETQRTHTSAEIAASVLRCTLLYHVKKIPELNRLNENDVHIIHFHAFRKFFYTTVSNVIGSDYANALLGHHSYLDTYYNLPKEKRNTMYLKAEPYLTISDFTKVERDLISVSEKQSEIEKDHLELIRIIKQGKLDAPKILRKYRRNIE